VRPYIYGDAELGGARGNSPKIARFCGCTDGAETLDVHNSPSKQEVVESKVMDEGVAVKLGVNRITNSKNCRNPGLAKPAEPAARRMWRRILA